MKSRLLSVLCVAVLCSAARAEIVIDGGTHGVAPDAIQTVNVYVTGDGETVECTNLCFQIGDGSNAWPAIAGVDITGPGTLFAENHLEPYIGGTENGRAWLALMPTEEGSIAITGRRLFARVMLDTTGAALGQVVPFRLTNLFPEEFGEPGISCDFGLTPCTVYDGTITVGQVGDFTVDGEVDDADLDVWKANIGRTDVGWLQGDANNDGEIDGLDLDLWKQYRGYSSLSDGMIGGSSLAVPEPCILAMLLTITPLGIAVACLRRK
jgi:hypothetical protein